MFNEGGSMFSHGLIKDAVCMHSTHYTHTRTVCESYVGVLSAM